MVQVLIRKYRSLKAKVDWWLVCNPDLEGTWRYSANQAYSELYASILEFLGDNS